MKDVFYVQPHSVQPHPNPARNSYFCYIMIQALLHSLALLSLLLALPGCKASGNRKSDDPAPVLVRATREAWTAGHRSGGRGVEFRIYLTGKSPDTYSWESLESGGKTLEIRKMPAEGDTTILQATWLSNTDPDFNDKGVPDFSSGRVQFSRNQKTYYLDIPAFEILKGPPRP